MKNIIFALVALIIFFLGAELLCRLRYKPQEISYQGIFEYDRDKVYALKKNHQGLFIDRLVTTNSFGYRGTEIPVKKDGNVIRILAVGDSVTFGPRVEAEETYPKRLQAILNREITRYRFEVINTAVPGNSPFQEYYDLKRGLIFAPDIVIIQFVLNDVIEPYAVYRRYGGRGIDYHGVEDISYLHYLLSQHSALYVFLNKLYTRIKFLAVSREKLEARVMQRAAQVDWSAAAFPSNDPKIVRAWRECLRWEQKQVDLCKRHKIDCILLVSPCDFQMFHPEKTYAQQVLKDFALKNGIEYVDLLPYLEAEARQKAAQQYLPKTENRVSEAVLSKDEIESAWSDYFSDYDHYNAKGHLFVAETALYPVISKILKKRKSFFTPS